MHNITMVYGIESIDISEKDYFEREKKKILSKSTMTIWIKTIEWILIFTFFYFIPDGNITECDVLCSWIEREEKNYRPETKVSAFSSDGFSCIN